MNFSSLRYRLSWLFSVIRWRNIQDTIALELSCLHSLHLGLAGHWGRGHRFTQALLAKAGHAEQPGARHGHSVCSTRATSSSVLELQKEAEPYWWTQHEEDTCSTSRESQWRHTVNDVAMKPGTYIKINKKK